jgi:predicted enzyme related to lactoylglutathione lyase
MTSMVANICLDCADPWTLAGFWSEALGIRVDPDCSPGDEEVGFELPTGQWLLCLKVPEPKTVKNRVHLCLRPEGSRDDEVERLLALGATMYDDRRKPDGTGWAVLADPEGNELCVLRSRAEIDATT